MVGAHLEEMLGFSTTKIFKLGGMILILFGCPVSGGDQRTIHWNWTKGIKKR